VRTQDSAGFHDHCFISVKKPDAGFDASCIEPGGQPLVFLWGDSTAAALYPGLKYAETTHDFRLARFSQAACAPILDSPRNERCNGLNALAFRYLQSSRPDVVLLHATWGDYRSLDGLEETISRLKALNVPRIVIVGPVPVWKRTLPHAIINTYRFRHELPKRIASGVSGPEADEAMREFSLAHGTEYISVRRSVCNPEGCLALVDGSSSEVFTTDRHHLSEGRLSVSDRVDRRGAFCFPTKDWLTQNGSDRRADTALSSWSSSWFTRSSFSVPRITVFNAASGNGRCSAFASFPTGMQLSDAFLSRRATRDHVKMNLRQDGSSLDLQLFADRLRSMVPPTKGNAGNAPLGAGNTGMSLRSGKVLATIACAVILLLQLVAMSKWPNIRGIHDDLCYLRQAHLFQTLGVHGLNTDITLDTDNYFRDLIKPVVPDGTPVCHPSSNPNGHRVLQFPPGPGFLLSLFPDGNRGRD